ncbi:UNVERIFIED_CONTAM: hypothetical protein PYX00_000973 [Menopon gallinae]|uniref:REKLES domain-containing protein n=1 Tax=Menopon gallinae TaxID=328185 RepID=A0AAW2IC94_9NEOP
MKNVSRYMKYLYPYECEKRRLSTPSELQAAIDGNRREGRRSSYGTYPELMQRSPGPTHPSQMSPLSLANQLRPQVNGNGHLHHPVLHPTLGQPPLPAGPIPGLAPSEFEARMVEYVKLLNKELRTSTTTPPTIRQGSNSPPSSTSPREALSAIEMSRLTLWNLYNNNHTSSTPEPQKEALDLGVKEQQQQSQRQTSPQVKREPQDTISNGPPPKKLLSEEEGEEEASKTSAGAGIGGAHIKITNRGDGRGGQDNSLVVSMDINGIVYQGVLFAQNATRSRSS